MPETMFIWLNLNAVLIVTFSMLKTEKNDGNRAGDQTGNYLLIANYLLQEDYTQWQQL